MTDTTAYKNNSYTVQRNVPKGTLVRTVADAYYQAPIPAGTTGTVERYVNEGFGGISARIRLADGRLVRVNAGILTVA